VKTARTFEMGSLQLRVGSTEQIGLQPWDLERENDRRESR
jgi:hypothetical protein